MEDPSVQGCALRQYRAALDMLRHALEECPEDLWFSTQYPNRFWHVAYHSLFYTHLYVQPSEAGFHAWSKHVPDANFLGPGPWAKGEPFRIPEPYSKQDLLEYWELCAAEVERHVPLIRPADGSGFSWLPFNKLELQFYNIRHLQHHTGQLIERLRTGAGIGIGWVGSASRSRF